MNIVKFLRLINSHTQEEIAKYLGCTVSTYNRKEKEVVDFTAQEYILLSKFYSIPVEKLLDTTGFNKKILDVIYS
ncbi:MAG: helix-turn-helix transcriptional regulator [Peptostreptococcaceae bacterium]|nr:helix-turn-helix transcriptional regulator [Peptostreptococcaceae bacterium]